MNRSKMKTWLIAFALVALGSFAMKAELFPVVTDYSKDAKENVYLTAENLRFLAEMFENQKTEISAPWGVFRNTKSLSPEKRNFIVETNFSPSASFLDFLKKWKAKIKEKNLKTQASMELFLTSKTKFFFVDEFKRTKAKEPFYCEVGELRTFFFYGVASINFSQDETGIFLGIPIIQKDAADKSPLVFEIILPKERMISAAQINYLRERAKPVVAEIFLPEIDTEGSFDFLKNCPTPIFQDVCETFPVLMVLGRENTRIKMNKDGLSFSSSLAVKLRGIGTGEQPRSPDVIVRVDKAFYFQVRSADSVYCAGKISSPRVGIPKEGRPLFAYRKKKRVRGKEQSFVWLDENAKIRVGKIDVPAPQETESENRG